MEYRHVTDAKQDAFYEDTLDMPSPRSPSLDLNLGNSSYLPPPPPLLTPPPQAYASSGLLRRPFWWLQQHGLHDGAPDRAHHNNKPAASTPTPHGANAQASHLSDTQRASSPRDRSPSPLSTRRRRSRSHSRSRSRSPIEGHATRCHGERMAEEAVTLLTVRGNLRQVRIESGPCRFVFTFDAARQAPAPHR